MDSGRPPREVRCVLKEEGSGDRADEMPISYQGDVGFVSHRLREQVSQGHSSWLRN